MKMYFSGLQGKAEIAMVRAAGIRYALMDQFQYAKNGDPGFPHLVLDSGAYRVFKKGGKLDIPRYLDTAASRTWDFVVCPDVIGDAEASLANWELSRLTYPEITPVWHWGSDLQILRHYLDHSALVCIGALVNLMRAKDEAMLSELAELCRNNPGRFHILGINWLRAIRILKDDIASGDSSKFLDGGRYRSIIFIHTKTGCLQQCPQKILPEYAQMGREELCIESARNMMLYCQENSPPPCKTQQSHVE